MVSVLISTLWWVDLVHCLVGEIAVIPVMLALGAQHGIVWTEMLIQLNGDQFC